MPVSYVGQATGVTTATLPTHQAGDLILAFAYRDGSTTAPTVPSPFTAVTAGTGAGVSGAANSSVVASYIAAGAGTSSGTWTNATSVVFLVYRGASGPGAIAGDGNTNSSSVVYPTLALQRANGTSWVAGFAGHQSSNVTLETAPTGMTNRANVTDATDEASGHDTNGGVTSWSQQTVNVGGTTASWRSWTVEILETDTTAPTVSTFSPANGATAVARGGNIVLTFNEYIQRGTGTITIRSGSASGTILESIDAASSARISISTTTLTIDPTDTLPNQTTIFVVIPSGAIQDYAGNNYAGTSTYSFTTADDVAPTVTTFSPAADAIEVDPTTNIALTFSETVQRGTGTITLRSGSAAGTIIESFDAASSSRITVSGSTVTIDPTSNLAEGTLIFLVIPSGAIKDASNNNYAGTSTYSFTTDTYVSFPVSPSEGTPYSYKGRSWVYTYGGWVQQPAGGAGGAIIENLQSITASYTLTNGRNGITAGPVTIASGVTVTVPSGANWVIV